jgi:hypothetical protein
MALWDEAEGCLYLSEEFNIYGMKADYRFEAWRW